MTSETDRVDSALSAPPKLAKRVASGTIWIALEMASTQLMSLVVFAVMARFVTPADFGLISITYLAIYSLKTVFIDSAVLAIVRKKEPSDLDYTTSFWLTLLFAGIVSIVVFLGSGEAQRLMHAPHLGEVMRAMSVIPIFMGLARTHEMRLTRTFQFRALAIRGAVGSLVGGAIGIALAVCHYGLSALVIQQIATSGITVALLWVSSSWIPGLRVSRRAAIEILRFVRSILPTSVTSVVTQNFDTFLVAFFFGPATAGLFAIAKRLRLALQLVTSAPLSGVILSALAEVQDNKERLRRVSQRMVELISFTCLPVFVGASSLSGDAILVGFGEKWVAAAPIFAVLSLGGFFTAIQSFSDAIFVLKNRQIWSFYVLFTQMVIAVLIFIQIKEFGSYYVATPFVAPFIVTFPLVAILVSRLIGLSLLEWIAAVIPPLISSAMMFGIVEFIIAYTSSFSDVVRILVCLICGAATYLTAMATLKREMTISVFNVFRNAIR